MLNPIHLFRSKRHAAPRLVVLGFWVISTLNLFISPAFSFPEKDQTRATAFQVAHSADTSILEALLYLLYAGVNPNADLADSMEDSIDKVEFIAATGCSISDCSPARRGKFLPAQDVLAHADLEKNTPPPKRA